MQFVDLKTLAKQTSLSVPTLRKYLRQGMPHLRLEHKILVDPQEARQWLEARFKVVARDEWIDTVDELATTFLAG